MDYEELQDIENWEAHADGSSGDIALERSWLRKAREVFVLFKNKQRGYGPANISQGGEAGIVLRANDKQKRMFTLTFQRNGEEPLEDESKRDTAMDLADYYLIWLMVHDGDWPRYADENQIMDIIDAAKAGVESGHPGYVLARLEELERLLGGSRD